MTDFEDMGEWIAHGIKKGWVSQPFCNTHDIDPIMTDEEQKEWEDGGDPCQHVMRFTV